MSFLPSKRTRRKTQGIIGCFDDGLTSIPGKGMEQLIMEMTFRHLKNKKISRNSQAGFTKGKSCLINLITCSEMADLVDEGRAVDVDYFDFGNAFDTTSLSLRMLLKYRLKIDSGAA